MPILPAPFDQAGALDLDSLATVVQRVAAAGADGAVLFGLVTEYYKLTDEERRQMIATARAAMPSTCKLVVSITAHATELAVADARRATAMGADALMIMPPFFLQPTPAAISEHITAVAQAAAPVPVIVQYAPVQTGLNLTAETFAQWRQALPNVEAVKVEAVPPGPLCSEIVAASGGRMGIFVGYAGLQWPDILRRVGGGCMPSCAFIEQYVRLGALWRQGAIAEAEALHARMLPLIEFCMRGIEEVIACEKVLLRHRGWIQTEYRRHPAHELPAEQRERLIRLYEELQTGA